MNKINLWLFGSMFLFLCCGKKNDQQPIKEPVKPEVPTEVIKVEDCEKCIVLAEQLKDRVAIVDQKSGKIIWEWKPAESNVAAAHLAWFGLIDEVKPVYNSKYILMTATRGAIALIRIKDKKTVWYANAAGQPHSAELLPDGNIISASSTGNLLTLFHVDTLVAANQGYRKTIVIQDGHNVVWDKQRQRLWATSNSSLKAFSYNNNCTQPDLTEIESISTPGVGSHDLFPVYGEDALWLSNSTNVYKFNINTKAFTLLSTSLQSNIKSVSSGPQGFPVLLLKPKVEYWSDEVKDADGNRIFQENDLKIYKARWFVNNAFSYPENHSIKQCN
jgi:hypothetical protein